MSLPFCLIPGVCKPAHNLFMLGGGISTINTTYDRTNVLVPFARWCLKTDCDHKHLLTNRFVRFVPDTSTRHAFPLTPFFTSEFENARQLHLCTEHRIDRPTRLRPVWGLFPKPLWRRRWRGRGRSPWLATPATTARCRRSVNVGFHSRPKSVDTSKYQPFHLTAHSVSLFHSPMRVVHVPGNTRLRISTLRMPLPKRRRH